MNFNNYTCDGQMNIFDFLEAPAPAINPIVKSDNEILIECLKTYGTGFRDGKRRIVAIINGNTSEDEQNKAISKEFGMGGCSWIPDNKLGYCGNFHDAKGLEVNWYDDTHTRQSKHYTWKEVRQELKQLINSGNYYTQRDIDEYKCSFSNHICNSNVLWDIAINDLGIDCPKTCCRQCKHNTECGCACNGAR